MRAARDLPPPAPPEARARLRRGAEGIVRCTYLLTRETREFGRVFLLMRKIPPCRFPEGHKTGPWLEISFLRVNAMPPRKARRVGQDSRVPRAESPFYSRSRGDRGLVPETPALSAMEAYCDERASAHPCSPHALDLWYANLRMERRRVDGIDYVDFRGGVGESAGPDGFGVEINHAIYSRIVTLGRVRAVRVYDPNDSLDGMVMYAGRGAGSAGEEATMAWSWDALPGSAEPGARPLSERTRPLNDVDVIGTRTLGVCVAIAQSIARLFERFVYPGATEEQRTRRIDEILVDPDVDARFLLLLAFGPDALWRGENPNPLRSAHVPSEDLYRGMKQASVARRSRDAALEFAGRLVAGRAAAEAGRALKGLQPRRLDI